jgi:hypothetical protein
MAKALILRQLIDKLGLQMATFERSIGVSNATIKSAIERDSEISINVVGKIVTAYPQVNIDWLTTGKGNMFIPESNVSFNGKINTPDNANSSIDNINLVGLNLSDMSNPNGMWTALMSVIESNRQMAEANKMLAETNHQLVTMLKQDYTKKAMATS